MTYEPPLYQLERTVFFVGFMGAGKTSVVRRLARLCGATAVDTDRFQVDHTAPMRLEEDIQRRDVVAVRPPIGTEEQRKRH